MKSGFNFFAAGACMMSMFADIQKSNPANAAVSAVLVAANLLFAISIAKKAERA